MWEIITLAAMPYQGSSNEQVVENVQNGIGNKLVSAPDCPPLL